MSNTGILPTKEPDTPCQQGLMNPPHRILVVDDEDWTIERLLEEAAK
jgi:hypothetical protein